MYKKNVWLRRLDPQHLKRLVGVVVILIVLTTLATVWLWHKQGQGREIAFASTLLRKTELLNARFDRFLEPVLLDLRALGQMGERGVLSTENVELTRGIVEPIVNVYGYQDPNESYRNRISSFQLANVDGRGFTLTCPSYDWHIEWHDAGHREEWFSGAVGVQAGVIHWTEPHGLGAASGNDLTVSLAFESGSDSLVHVVAFNIALREVAHLIDQARYSDDDRLFLYQNRRVTDLLRRHRPTQDGDRLQGMSDHSFADPVIHAAVGALANGNSDERAMSFQIGKKIWWVSSVPFEYGNSRGDLCLVVPEAYLARQISSPTTYKITAVIVLCVLAMSLAWLLLGQGVLLQRALTYSGHRQDGEEALLHTIAEGENAGLEFKSTLRWNLQIDKPGKEIELACLKTMVAFLNSEGGTLMVGVKDDGHILGIEADNFPNEDKFLLHFNNLIKQHIGLEHSKHIRFSIKRIQSHSVLVVDCQKSDKPVFLKDKGDEDFYVRVGPGTRKLSTREVLKSLHSQRWGKASEDT